ncbi:MAG: hydroxyacylglutathione hydrolase, partial [Gammaproteobacteria bacterium]
FLTQQKLALAGILVTHHHWDHCHGVVELKQHYDVPVYGSQKEKTEGVTHHVQEGDQVELTDELILRVMDIPGHTLGHIAYYGPEMVFCGDTLFAAGCGRLFEGTAEQLYHSLQKLAALPAETKVYCGHEYTLNNLRFAKAVEPTNQRIDARMERVSALVSKQLPSLPSVMQEEKETNPFLRCDSTEVRKNVEKQAGKPLSDPVQVFAELRKWKDSF